MVVKVREECLLALDASIIRIPHFSADNDGGTTVVGHAFQSVDGYLRV
jgi:hypothetical protein